MIKSSHKSTNVRWNRVKVGLITLAFILLFNWILGKSAYLYDLLYFKSVFQVFRVMHDFTLGYLPVPSLYIIAPIFIGYFFINRVNWKWWFMESMISCLLWIVVFFYVTWGFNYQQPTIYKILNLEKVAIDSAYITNTFIRQSKKLDSLLLNDIEILSLSELESTIRTEQEELFGHWNVPVYGRVRVRKLFEGSLLHLRTSGIYIPHAFEGHMDGGIYAIQYPFTMAHEMAHGYGFTDESVCNFIAYLTCIDSQNKALEFSAELAYWRYLVGYYRYFHKEKWSEEYENLNPKLRYHLEQIRIHIDRFDDWMPKYRDVIYDQYLKTHGVKAGIRSYDEMILLIAAYHHDMREQK